MDVGEWLERAGKCVQFMAQFFTLKMCRTMVISVLVCLVILIIRGAMGKIDRVRKSSLYSYIRMYLWTVLLVVPFTGMIKISGDSFPIRRWTYLILYSYTMGRPVVVCVYLVGLAVILLVLLGRHIGLRRKIKRMEICTEFNLGWRITVRRTAMSVTPFTTGFFHYTIVLPECILEGCSEEELADVIGHEYIHIRRGHLIFSRLIGLCQIMWFPNPLIHLCARMIREDMEVICDRETIRASGDESERYGMLLLKSLQLIRGQSNRQAAGKITMGFASERAFRDMKRRVGMIADYRASRRRPVRFLMAGGVAVMLSLLVFVKSISYDSYTAYGDYDMYMYDNMIQVLKDSEEMESLIETQDEGLLVANQKMKDLLAREGLDLEAEYWIYFGGYMKLPGIGGGGDIVNYCPAKEKGEYALIPYTDQLLANRVLDWFMRYI